MADRGTEQPTSRGRREQGPDRAAAGGLPADGHPFGIPTEGGDVALHPAQGLDLVQQTSVVRGVGDPAEAVEAEPVREGHRHDAVAVEGAAVVPGAGRRPRLVAAAVDPDEHRQSGGGLTGHRGEHVDVQRRVARDGRFRDGGHLAERTTLGRRTVRARVADARPGSGRDRRGEAVRSDRGLGERQPEEGGRAVVRSTRAGVAPDTTSRALCVVDDRVGALGPAHRPASSSSVTVPRSAAVTSTVIGPGPVGRTTASARPSNVRQVSESNRSVVLGFALQSPARTPLRRPRP